MLRQMNFIIVVTPLLLSCDGFNHPERRHVFQCGDYKSSSDYCISGGLVCDGHVNCMIPGREGIDEEDQYCRNSLNNNTTQREITKKENIIFISCLIFPFVFSCCCLIGKLYGFFIRKRDFFIKLGEELEERNIIVAPSASESMLGPQTNKMGMQIQDYNSQPNYLQIIHETDEV